MFRVEVIHSKKWKICTQDYLRPKTGQNPSVPVHNNTKMPAANIFLTEKSAAGGTYPYKVEVTFSFDLSKIVRRELYNMYNRSAVAVHILDVEFFFARSYKIRG